MTVVLDAEFRTVHLKLEGHNRYGSIKFRTAESLVDTLERDGRLSPGDQLVESTSGNLGVVLAGIAAERGYRFLAFVDPRTPPALLATMRGLRAEIDTVTEPDGAGGYLLSRLRRVRQIAAVFALAGLLAHAVVGRGVAARASDLDEPEPVGSGA